MALLDFFKKRKEVDRFLNKKRMKAGDVFEKQKRDSAVLKKEEESKVPKKSTTFIKTESYNVLKSPHITEKSSIAMEGSAYVFKVRSDANKIMIKKVIKDLYGARAKKINIINIHRRKRFIKGKRGNKPGFKKAIVYLKKGEKIDVL